MDKHEHGDVSDFQLAAALGRGRSVTAVVGHGGRRPLRLIYVLPGRGFKHVLQFVTAPVGAHMLARSITRSDEA